MLNVPILAAGIQDVFRRLADDRARTTAIAAEIAQVFNDGRKLLVLTERTEHLDAIKAKFGDRVEARADAEKAALRMRRRRVSGKSP